MHRLSLIQLVRERENLNENTWTSIIIIKINGPTRLNKQHSQMSRSMKCIKNETRTDKRAAIALNQWLVLVFVQHNYWR